MKFRPLHDRVLVERLESEEKSAGGIIIPKQPRKSRSRARSLLSAMVCAMSRARCRLWMSRQGDTILFGKWSGTEVKLDGTEYLIMKESDIMGILD